MDPIDRDASARDRNVERAQQLVTGYRLRGNHTDAAIPDGGYCHAAVFVQGRTNCSLDEGCSRCLTSEAHEWCDGETNLALSPSPKHSLCIAPPQRLRDGLKQLLVSLLALLCESNGDPLQQLGVGAYECG